MDWLIALGQVLLIDIVLAGDNAIVVGMAAAGLPTEQRRKAILWGIGAATIMRIGFAAITTQLLAIVGITLAGGVLLLWVCWKMFRELRNPHAEHHGAEAAAGEDTGLGPDGQPKKTLRQAITQILVADISMSLDNVLAVAGAAKDHLEVLIIGLAISVVLMGVAATFIAGLLDRYRWIAWIGLAVILYVAADMIYDGTHEVAERVPGAYAYLLLPLGYLAVRDAFPAWLWVGATAFQVVILSALVAVVTEVVRGAMRRPAPRHLSDS
ncbi:TerC family protein [Roseomonas sp. CCTCC AB2023176]|uniref:TerC family protein n=1 Tax=Roseomonas sp. CCTCC AB2023176 TaxID=3342640 RepID=UPI0035E12948